jgi:inner membrane protein
MDSITQAVLGAAIGEAVLGRRVGRKAAAWGAVLGTLPDLDVLIPRGGPVADFTYHRTETHSLFFLTLAAPAIAWLLWRLHRHARVPAGAVGTAAASVGGAVDDTVGSADWRHWWLMCWLALVTHPLLDALTIYGTQLGLPFTDHPFGTGSVFVLDPAYTMPVLLGLLAALVLPRRGRLGRRLNLVGLALGTAYLAFGLVAQQLVQQHARAELARQGVRVDRLFATPTPLNGVLWRIVAVSGDRWCEGFRSLLDGAAPLTVQCRDRAAGLLAPLAGSWPTERLRWFTKGWYAVEQVHLAESGPPSLLFKDLRMGQAPNFVFSFALADVVDGRVIPRVHEAQVPLPPGARNLGWVWRRIGDPSLPPP